MVQPGCCLIDWLWFRPWQVWAGWQWAGLGVSQVSLKNLGVAIQMVSWILLRKEAKEETNRFNKQQLQRWIPILQQRSGTEQLWMVHLRSAWEGQFFHLLALFTLCAVKMERLLWCGKITKSVIWYHSGCWKKWRYLNSATVQLNIKVD